MCASTATEIGANPRTVTPITYGGVDFAFSLGRARSASVQSISGPIPLASVYLVSDA